MSREALEEMQGPLLRGMVQHLNYLTRVEATLAGQDDFAGTLHTECALGKMMLEKHSVVASQCPPDMQAMWQELDQLHEAFHGASRLALTDHNQQATLDMESLSMKIIDRLGQFESELKSCLG